MMYNPELIKTFKEEVTLYPNKKAVKVDILGSDNKIFEATIPKSEVELYKYLKFSVFPKLKERERTQLLDKIEKFGFERYEDGSFDESYEG